MITVQTYFYNKKCRFNYVAEYLFLNETYDESVNYYDYDLEIEPIETKEYHLGFVTEKLAKLHCKTLTPSSL